MKPFTIPRIVLLSAILVLGFSPEGRTADDSLLSNGGFEVLDGDSGRAKDWPGAKGVELLEEEGNHFLRFTASPDRMLTVYREVGLSPDVKALKLTFKVRVNDLKAGKVNWHDGRVIMDFRNAAGEKMNPSPPHPNFKKTTEGWVERSVDFLVPEGVARISVMPSLFQCQSGSYDIDDVVLTKAEPAPIIARIEEAARKKAAEIARRAALVKPQVPVAPQEKLPPMLSVKGNQIIDPDGNAIWLQGVSMPSMEWSAGGENILKSVATSIEDWNANVIRLAIRENFWAGVGPYQLDGGAGYRQLVDDVVNLAGSHGVYVVLDLHRFRAPEAVHADFWKKIAIKYGNHPAVMFELYNEPHDISWDVWLNGGFVSEEKKKDSDALAENKEKLKGFESIGIQKLIDAVRNEGAKNILIVGGLDWSYDLSGILTGFAPNDRDGNGIVYSTHVYPWKSGWQKMFMDVAEKHPIFIGECGATQERMSFIPPERHEDPSTWVPDFLGLVQEKKYHWTAWSFHPRASPCLLTDWEYTPTPYWGVPAKAALNGKIFERGKLR